MLWYSFKSNGTIPPPPSTTTIITVSDVAATAKAGTLTIPFSVSSVTATGTAYSSTAAD